MKLIVDANIVIAALIKNNITRKLLFNENLSLFSVSFLLKELNKHKKVIKEKTNLDEDEFANFKVKLLKKIYLIKIEELTNYIDDAIEISPDIKDAHYFSLALKLNCPIWSNDKELKKQKKIKIVSTEDLLMESIFS